MSRILKAIGYWFALTVLAIVILILVVPLAVGGYVAERMSGDDTHD